MANLNDWQKITRVIPGSPFGDGRDGALTSTTIPNLTRLSVSGTATQSVISATAGNFVANDVVLLHQSRGTGAGQWEFVKITADNANGTYNVTPALNYTYTDSGASQAQIVTVPQYSSVNIASGTWTLADWDGNTGGLFPLFCNGSASFANTTTATGKGLRGGNGAPDGENGSQAYQGEGTAGAGGQSVSANGDGGGGGLWSSSGGSYGSGGGGGGFGAVGIEGASAYGAGKGQPGATANSADLVTLSFGGGGGGGGGWNSAGANGGDAGGIVLLICKSITITGAVTTGGVAGSTAADFTAGCGGGGAGGAVLIVCQTATLGSNLITAPAGGKGTGLGIDGGDGGVGRIAVHHSGTVTGTSNPSFTDVTDATLVEVSGGNFLAFL